MVILDARHGPFRVLLQCSGDENVGSIALLLWSLFSSPCANQELKVRNLPDLSQGNSLLTVADLSSIVESIEVGEKSDNSDITLWWIRKPVPRPFMIKDKFGTNERTKCVVTLESETSAVPPAIPPWPDIPIRHEADAALSQTLRARIEDAINRAKEANDTRKLLTDDELSKLKDSSTGVQVSKRMKGAMESICLARDPPDMIKSLLEKDAEFRDLVDRMLITIGKAERDVDGCVQIL